MINIIGVRFKKIGKLYYFDPCDTQVKLGDHVIVETARGAEYGEVVLANTEVEDDNVVQPLKKLIRVATKNDDEMMQENERHAREAFDICKRKIAEHKLDMHLVTVECTFDLNKILFYFTADGRVDFRDLVKDLASVFRTRIELRQIGVRDEAKMLGGLGACGRELCCSSYLDDFQPVSINMAKEQNLSLNPAKISGTCGRLMCCLKYEHEVYSELQKVTPRVGSYVETPAGYGMVVSVQMLRGLCRVQLDDDPENMQIIPCVDCRTLRAAKGRGKPMGARAGGHENAAAPEARTEAPRAASNDSRTADAPTVERPARPLREKRERRDERPAQPRPAPTPVEPVHEDESAAPLEGGEGENKPRRRSRRGGRRRHKRTEGEAVPQSATVEE